MICIIYDTKRGFTRYIIFIYTRFKKKKKKNWNREKKLSQLYVRNALNIIKEYCNIFLRERKMITSPVLKPDGST